MELLIALGCVIAMAVAIALDVTAPRKKRRETYHTKASTASNSRNTQEAEQ